MLPNASNNLPIQEESPAIREACGVYDATNPAWVIFNAQMDAQLISLDERFRSYWTMQAVRASVGR